MSQATPVYESEIFLAVMGTTPQVLTECLYYYTHEYYKTQRTFSKIKVLTTLKGKEALVQTLFDGGQLSLLESALGVNTGYFNFSEADIIVFSDKNGNALSDLLSSEDNDYAKEQVSQTVRELTEISSSRLTATVAGGRKTMSALMALSFQLYGREADDLFHIIPPEERMNDSSWFFPENNSSSDQHLMVSQVPVIRVGRYLASDLSLSVDDLMMRIQASLKELTPISSLRVNKCVFTVNEQLDIKMSPRGAALFRALLKRRLNSGCGDDCSGCDGCRSSNMDIFNHFEEIILPELNILNGKLHPNTDASLRRWRDLKENRDEFKDLDVLESKQKLLVSEYKRELKKALG
ncbi:MAG: CRISPR-associated ring nuclease Csm6, partial [Bacteroidota bacterium]|nr:CRISPR-associated ring nuclease Csm6 [Bacteroidota bacterium]